MAGTPGPIRQHMGGPEWGMLGLLSLVWGGSFLFIAVAVTGLPPFTIVSLRVLIAAATLVAILFATGRRLPMTGSAWRTFFAMGLVNNAIPFACLVWGQTQVSAGLASILNSTMPIFTVIVAALLLADERITRGKIAGIAFGIAGVSVIVGPSAFAGLTGEVWGKLAVLGASVAYGAGVVLGRYFAGMRIDPTVAAAGQILAACVYLVPIALWWDRPWTLPMPSLPVIASVVALATLSTGFAYIGYFWLLARAGATNVSLVTFLVPITAVLLGGIVLGERLEPQHFAGMALIGLGLSAIDGRVWRRLGDRLRPKARAGEPEPAPAPPVSDA